MKRAKQKDFFEDQREFSPRRLAHGGAPIGLRKIRRPLDRRRPIHLVLKSESAKGKLSMLSARNRIAVDRIVVKWAKYFRVTLHSHQNVGNHLHIVASFTRAEHFQNFLRTITSLIARTVTGARKGHSFGKRFWDHLAFTRVIVGRRDFRGVRNYVRKNEIEAEFGRIAREVVEEFEAAMRESRRRGCDVWEILRNSSKNGSSR